MRHDTITRRRMIPLRRRSQPWTLVAGLAGLFVPGLRFTWRSFWRNVEHPRLVQGVVLLFPALALLAVLTHLALPQMAGVQRPSQATPHPVSSLAANQVQAFYQGDPSIGWDSSAQYEIWWPSACSPAALTMVLRAWGVQVGIGPVLDRLIAQHAITPRNGLLHADALATVAKSYGLHAQTFRAWPQAQLAQVTAQGVPVLVDLHDARQQTPYPGFVVGHWLVVVQVSAQQIEVRDSSGYHIHAFTPAVFHTLFTGVAVVIWQGTLSLPKEG